MTTMPVSDDAVHFPDLFRLRIAAYAQVVGWIGVALCALTVALALAYFREMENYVMPLLWSGFVLMAIGLIGAFGIAFRLRCAACGKRVIAESHGGNRREVDRLPGLNSFASAQVHALRGRPIRCVHCGVKYLTRN